MKQDKVLLEEDHSMIIKHHEVLIVINYNDLICSDCILFHCLI